MRAVSSALRAGGAPAPGGVHFHPAAPPTDEDVARLLATIRRRVRRLLQRRGLEPTDDLAPSDPLAEESLALAGISAASAQGRIVLGRRAGARVWRLGHDPEALCVPGRDRARLERLCRYVFRPPVAQDRLRLTAEQPGPECSSPLLDLGALDAPGLRHRRARLPPLWRYSKTS